MKKIFRSCVLATVGLLFGFNAYAQDPEVTQFFATPMYTNPAMTGTAFCSNGEPGGRFAIDYRNQWPSLPGTFRTLVAGWDQHFDNLGGGLGIMFTKDVAGTGKLSRTTIHGDYSFLIPLGKTAYLRLGIEAALFQQGIDYARLKFGDQIDPTRGFINETQEVFSSDVKTYPNFSAGALIYTKNFYAGIASHNITEPNQSFENDPYGTLPRRYTAHAGVTIPLDNRRVSESNISPNALFMMQDNFTQINLGVYINKGPLVTGLWFRQSVGDAGNSDALMALIGFRKDRFKFGYSYDITVSSARSAVPGSHEVSAAVDWCLSKRPIRFRPLRCPDF